ncbi:hypothetical protein PG985_016393 [Apiospora marii]|uniref:uncharacterized protein n=1 Tax=Apiospora marii TaxID=335849 RepID=UPI003130E276
MNVLDLISFLRVRPTLSAPLRQGGLALLAWQPWHPRSRPICPPSGNVKERHKRTSSSKPVQATAKGAFAERSIAWSWEIFNGLHGGWA